MQAAKNVPIVSNGIQQDEVGCYQWVPGEVTNQVDYYGFPVVTLVKKYIEPEQPAGKAIDYRPAGGHLWNYRRTTDYIINVIVIEPESCGRSNCRVCGTDVDYPLAVSFI